MAEITIDDRLARGRKRMVQLATTYEAERRSEETKLLGDLNREPSHAERLLIENAAALAIRQRWLRKQGRHREADDVARLLTRSLNGLGIKEGPAKPAETPLEYAQRKYGRLPVAQTAATASQSPDSQTPIGEAPSGHSEAAR